jgi:hypothetical protein
MAKWRRYVIGPNADNRSRVLSTETTMVKEDPGHYYRCEVWATAEAPVDNTIAGDRALDSLTREPRPFGATFRMLELWPDNPDPDAQRRKVEKLHRDTGQKRMPSEADLQRHPSMHRTDTLDFICCVRGEVYLMTDLDEVLMRPGDSVVIRGVNHAWSNRSNEPVLLAVSMIDAVPVP